MRMVQRCGRACTLQEPTPRGASFLDSYHSPSAAEEWSRDRRRGGPGQTSETGLAHH
jgi:hypothetical protein